MPLLAGCAQVAGRYRRYGEKLALCQHAGGSRSWASYDQVCADVQRGLRTTTWRVAPLSRVGLHAEPAPPRQSQSPVQLVRDQLPRMLAAVVGMVPGGQPTAWGCACEDAPRTTEPTEERQRRGRRYGPRAARGSTRRNAHEWRATETVHSQPGGAAAATLWPSWSPLVRSAGSAAAQLATWCSLDDPAHSGQPCMRTKIPSRDRRNCTRCADEQAELHRTGPRPPETPRLRGSWPGPDCDGSSVPGPLASPVAWAVSPRISPANRSTPPTRG